MDTPKICRVCHNPIPVNEAAAYADPNRGFICEDCWASGGWLGVWKAYVETTNKGARLGLKVLRDEFLGNLDE